jgi:predicted dehydrogenase
MVDRPFTRKDFVAGSSVAAASLALTTGSASTPAQTGGSARLKGSLCRLACGFPPPLIVGYARQRWLRDRGPWQLCAQPDDATVCASGARAHIAAIVSGNPDKLRRVGDAYGVPTDARHSYDAFEKIASDKRINAVYIVLPTDLHADWAIRGFAAGKHVLCEKPLALLSADCEGMIAAARNAKRKLMIAYRSEFEPYNLKAMRLMEQKAIGTVRLMRTEQPYHMGRPAGRKLADRSRAGGGGPLEDYGIYGLQAALYLTGEMPERISATAFRLTGDPRFAEIFVHVSSQWLFPSGAMAQLATSYDSAGTSFAVPAEPSSWIRRPAMPGRRCASRIAMAVS